MIPYLVTAVLGIAVGLLLGYVAWHRSPAPAPPPLPPLVPVPTPEQEASRAARDAETAAHAGELDPDAVAGKRP